MVISVYLTYKALHSIQFPINEACLFTNKPFATQNIPNCFGYCSWMPGDFINSIYRQIEVDREKEGEIGANSESRRRKK